MASERAEQLFGDSSEDLIDSMTGETKNKKYMYIQGFHIKVMLT